MPSTGAAPSPAPMHLLEIIHTSPSTADAAALDHSPGLQLTQPDTPSQDNSPQGAADCGTPSTKSEMRFELDATLRRHRIYGKDFIVDARYTSLRAVGQGAYGIVASFVDTLTQKTVAIKKVSNLFAHAQHTKRIMREIRLMSALQHPNILGLIDVIGPSTSHSDELYIVSELMDTDLNKMIKYGKPLSAEHQQAIMYQLILGIDHLHASGIVHRDLKPGNILLSRRCELKICDFGLARSLPTVNVNSQEVMTEYIVTRWYRAPEIVLNPGNYCAKIDIWSAGCIFAEMQLSRPLFKGHDYTHQLKLILEFLGSPSEEDMAFIRKPAMKTLLKKLPRRHPMSFDSVFSNLSDEGRALLQRMLAFNPDCRISARESLTTSYFDSLRSEEVERIPPSLVKADDIEVFPRKVEHLRIVIADEISRLRHLTELVTSKDSFAASVESMPHHCQASSHVGDSEFSTITLDETVCISAPTSTCKVHREEPQLEKFSSWRKLRAMCCAPCIFLCGIWGPVVAVDRSRSHS